MINFATLEAVRYGPELLPSCEYVSPTTGTEAEVLNLTRLPNNMLVRLKDVGAVRDPNYELRFKADSEVFQVPAAAIPNLRATDVLGFEPTQYDLLASHSARLAIYAKEATLTNYQVWHGLWVWKQTIADKLALGIPLTPEEKSIDEDLHISQTVQRGTLPAKIDRFLLYEYYPIYRETRALRKDVPATGIVVDILTPRKSGKEFVVLEKVSCERKTVDDNVRFTIWRDNDGSPASPFITLHTWAMHLDYDIPCFIPAIREIGLRLEAGSLQENYCCRYTYTIYKMTNILRARWFGEGPEELIKKVRSGVA